MVSKILAVSIIIILGAILISNFLPQGGGGPGAIISTLGASPAPSVEAKELVIYTYDGIASEWGLGPKIFPKFEQQCNCKLKVIARGDVGAMLSQLQFEKNSPKADVALGFDNTFRQSAVELDLFDPHSPENMGGIDPSLFDGDYRFVPFDWGYVAFVYDSEKLAVPPRNLDDLLLPEYNKKFVIEDARTSSTGKVFLFWVALEYGEGTREYLQRLKTSTLTVTPGWSEAYNLFLQGEVPMVLSYTTSPAYHIENENTTKYKAAIFPRMYRQIEYVSIVKGARNRELAEQFVEFMISEAAQAEVPLGNYMYPARQNTELPESFKGLGMPAENSKEIGDGKKWLGLWEEVFSG